MSFLAESQLGVSSAAATYIEDVFSTWLYTGTGNGQNINNNIALQTTPSFVAYSKQGLDGGISSDSFTSQAGDILVACSVNITTSPTLTVNSVARTASSTLTDTYGYFNNVYIVSLSAGTTTYSFTGGSGNYNIFVVRGASSVAVSAGLSETTGASLTTTSFSSAGFGLVYVNDRDAYTSITPAAGSYTVTQAQGIYFVSKISTINGNGTTVPATTISGLDATYRSVYCTFNVLGLSSSVATTTGYGGMVWIKDRTSIVDNFLANTETGPIKFLSSDSTNGQSVDIGLQAFTANGFQVGGGTYTNPSPDDMVSWTFRKQAKFFDVVTYTGDGVAGRTVAHNLGSTPGCVMVKRTDTTSNWQVYHSGLTSAAYAIQLNLQAAQASSTGIWNSTAPTSTVFTVGANTTVNASGGTYVAYLFASNAGGFGSAGTDNVITCGSYSGSASAQSITLGYEPQWILIRRINAISDWIVQDTLRGMAYDGLAYLAANSSGIENTTAGIIVPTATGFRFTNGGYSYWNNAGDTYIYIAIRRGPLKTPTAGTQVLSIKNYSATNVVSTATVTHDVTYDLDFSANRTASTAKFLFVDLLRGPNGTTLRSNSTVANNLYPTFWSRKTNRTSAAVSATDAFWASATAATNDHISYAMVRSPGVFDEVMYVGTGTNTTFNHNLGVAPELIIIKKFSAASTTGWLVGATAVGYGNKLYFNLTNASAADSTAFNSTAPTSTVFSVGTNTDCNASGASMVAYLFATLAGVSKVGAYSGTGATQTIDCGFTSGARWVMIKRTDTTGDWYVWDTVRGMVAGTDPSLLFNSTAAEVNANSVYTVSTGFQIVSTAAGINASGGTYLYMAFA